MANQQTTEVATSNGDKSFMPAPLQTQLTQTALVLAQAECKEVEGMFIASQHFKRDTKAVTEEVKELCSNLAIAEEGLYSYYRGGALVEGLSVDVVEDIACIYGRIKSGWIMLEQVFPPGQTPYTVIRCAAIDYQSLKKTERTLNVRHISYGRLLTSDEEIYLHCANVAQRRTRACIEALIRSDILKAAHKQIIETLTHADKRPIGERIKAMVEAFKEIGVNEAMIRKWSNCPLDGITLTQLVKLRAMFKSIKDGAPVGMFFDKSMASPQAKAPQAEHAKDSDPEHAKDKAQARGKRGAKPVPAAAAEEKSTTPTASEPSAAGSVSTDPKPAGSASEQQPIPLSTPESTTVPPPELQVPPELVEAEPVDDAGDVDEGNDWSSQFQ